MEGFLTQLDELTSSWHWQVFSDRETFKMRNDIVDFFTGIQCHHRIEVLSTVVVISPSGVHSAFITYKRYDKK